VVPPGVGAAAPGALDNVYTVSPDRNDGRSRSVSASPAGPGTRWERLHQLRMRGFLPADDPEWDELARGGLVVVEKGRVRLTPEGRDAHAAWAAAAPGSEAAIAADTAYAHFQSVNPRLLKVCHDWQIARGGIPNDHTDPGYDDRVIGRLRDVHVAAGRILDGLVPAMPRFGTYAGRFDDALARLSGGQREWFASPACDSYHTVWMQFHEDLLLATGRSRADEDGA
jgi:hypothetical protein